MPLIQEQFQLGMYTTKNFISMRRKYCMFPGGHIFFFFGKASYGCHTQKLLFSINFALHTMKTPQTSICGLFLVKYLN